MSSKKNTAKKPRTQKSGQALRKEALAITQGNLARIEAAEGGVTNDQRDSVPVDEVLAAGSPAPKKSRKPKAGPAKDKPAKAPKPAKEKKEKKMSGLDAAAKVLAESKEPMNAVDLVKTMADKGYWSS